MGTELAVVDPKTYAILDPTQDVKGLVEANLGGESITPFDLTRIKVPAGGGTAWDVPTLSGSEMQKSIEGVLIHVARRRAYWASNDPSGEPPDCSSADGEYGVGKPGGSCDLCPLNEFGSAKNGEGRGKACKESRLLFMMRPTDRMPIVVAAPPGSLKAIKQYALQLSNHGLPMFGVVTKLELSKVNNKDGIAFSQIKPSVSATLPKESIDAMRSYAASLKDLFAATSVDRDDVEG